jgi:hypothetical protein
VQADVIRVLCGVPWRLTMKEGTVMSIDRENEAPNAGQGVSDDTEPAEEYELDQLTDQRENTAGESVADQVAERDDSEESG